MSLPSGIKAGADATYGLSGKTGLTGLNVGASYAKGPIFASAVSSSKFSAVTLGLTYTVSPAITVGSLTTHSSDKACDIGGIGGSYKADFGTIKAKYSAGGVLSASLIKDIAPKVTLTASGSASMSDFSTFKYGVGIVM
jgi:voltage-dependent anion channel protein 2